LHIGLNIRPEPVLAKDGSDSAHFEVDGFCSGAFAQARRLITGNIIALDVANEHTPEDWFEMLEV